MAGQSGFERKLPPGAIARVMDGNKAAAWGVLRCQPDVIAAYPITPQTPLLETLWKFCADGTLRAEAIEVEGELSAISVLIGAAGAGGRTFTATSSQGLAFMFEGLCRAAGLRLPIVMVVATRELTAPDGVVGSQQDVMVARDAGWIQWHMESCQEILDSMIMAYRLAEDCEVLLPVLVCYDGYFLSHLSDRVEIPSQEMVDRFLAPLAEQQPARPTLSLENPLTFGVYAPGLPFVEYRHKHVMAMQRAKEKMEQIDREFSAQFGRNWGGLIEEYRCADAEVALIAVGSAAGTVRHVVDARRAAGDRVGMIKLRSIRPFPRERLAAAFEGLQGIGVLDRNVNFGWGGGSMLMEVKAVLGELDTRIPIAGFVDGIAGMDITIPHINRAFDIIETAARGERFQEVTWLALEEYPKKETVDRERRE